MYFTTFVIALFKITILSLLLTISHYRYENISRFELKNCSLQMWCGAVSCAGMTQVSDPCLGKCQPKKAWALCGTLDVQTPSIPHPIEFKSTKITKIFIHEAYLKENNFSRIARNRDLQDCAREVIEQYLNNQVEWTLLGYYKPSRKGNYNTHGNVSCTLYSKKWTT